MQEEQWHLVNTQGISLNDPQRSAYERQAGKKKICLAFYRGEWHALDARCPHANGPLGHGQVEDGQVVCPWHRFGFDLKTGQSDSGGYYVNTYPVKVKNQRLWVKVKPRRRWWKFW
ncbi:MAG: Rieske 2Fe-2S domain-containing protein [Bacteroidota bacterium]